MRQNIHGVLVDYRVESASVGQVGVLRISFLKTLQVVQGLWQFLELSAGQASAATCDVEDRRRLRHMRQALL